MEKKNRKHKKKTELIANGTGSGPTVKDEDRSPKSPRNFSTIPARQWVIGVIKLESNPKKHQTPGDGPPPIRPTIGAVAESFMFVYWNRTKRENEKEREREREREREETWVDLSTFWRHWPALDRRDSPRGPTLHFHWAPPSRIHISRLSSSRQRTRTDTSQRNADPTVQKKHAVTLINIVSGIN